MTTDLHRLELLTAYHAGQADQAAHTADLTDKVRDILEIADELRTILATLDGEA